MRRCAGRQSAQLRVETRFFDLDGASVRKELTAVPLRFPDDDVMDLRPERTIEAKARLIEPSSCVIAALVHDVLSGVPS
jgi:hypothetical protein